MGVGGGIRTRGEKGTGGLTYLPRVQNINFSLKN